ncbi:MAG: SUMF1/EgtB/PvdO family nonheme iron enzyme [Acidobacteriota bacterium]
MKSKLSTFALVAVVSAISLPSFTASAQQEGRDLRVQKAVQGEQRVALVIGNSAYRDAPLLNPVNDAKDMSAALRALGFEVIYGENLSQNLMKRNIRAFGDKIRNGGVGLFYYAGHGIQISGVNYLVPVNAVITKEEEVEYESVDVGLVLAQMENARNRLNIVILDACRNNPFARSFRSTKNGLASIDAPSGTLIAYATAPGSVASDGGAGRNGLYTEELLRFMQTPDLNIEQVFKRVRIAVQSKTQGKQIPWESSSLVGDFFFSRTQPAPTPANPVPATDPAATELSFWESIKNSSDADDFKAYLEKYPSGTFATLAKNRIRTLEASAKSTPPNTSVPSATKPTSIGGFFKKVFGNPLPLRGFEFETVTVDSRGGVKEKRKGQARYFTEDINGVALEMVEIPGGTFLMGSPDSEAGRDGDEGPRHQVTLQSFYMGKFEVTQAQWRAVASLPKVSRDLDIATPDNPRPRIPALKGDNYPVEQVSWEDAIEFCARLSKARRREYRLPSEAEWEYACRAGTTTPFAFGETVTAELVNYNGQYPYASAPNGTYREKTTPVGYMDVANALGLYDMHGNVWEWCLDAWHDSYNNAPTDGSAWEKAGDPGKRVLRGGSWSTYGVNCRTAARDWFTPNNRYGNYGFRVVLVVRTR